jgi:hypothetical protein
VSIPLLDFCLPLAFLSHALQFSLPPASHQVLRFPPCRTSRYWNRHLLGNYSCMASSDP